MTMDPDCVGEAPKARDRWAAPLSTIASIAECVQILAVKEEDKDDETGIFGRGDLAVRTCRRTACRANNIAIQITCSRGTDGDQTRKPRATAHGFSGAGRGGRYQQRLSRGARQIARCRAGARQGNYFPSAVQR